MLRLSRIVLLACLSVAAARSATAEEIRYVEDFALAKDRAEALKQLIPGTEDFYYYHCLHYQHTEQFDKAGELLSAWIKRHNYTQRVHEILNRQALLQYDTKPEAALKRIRERLGLNFNHQREVLGRKPNLPERLDPKLIRREAFVSRENSRHENLQGYTDAALDWLVSEKDLSAKKRRHLLQRLRRPDYEGLVELIAADLKPKDSPQFGSFPIHQLLLPKQLAELLELKADLKNQANYVNARLAKLHPAPHVDWQNDLDEHQAFLDRLWSYVSTLDPVHNSLKASVLYRRLVFDRAGGEFNKERFLTYVRLPRRTSYANPKYLQRPEHVRYQANLGVDYSKQILQPPVGSDEALVRSYLTHFFKDAASWQDYEAYINDSWLKSTFAETKIVNGLGDAEQWSSLLSPAEFKALKERIDLDFAHTNKKVFGRDEPVSVDLSVKNVKSLIVRVFEINTANYYRDHLREVDTDISLDGLVANSEITKRYAEPPLRRVSRHFEFPQLTKPGVYVVDFIGNGKSSRVLIRKGKLRYVVRTSTAGHMFSVLDDHGEHVKDASVWLAGHEYKADKDGFIAAPFTAMPGSQPIILKQGEFASVDRFQHEAEDYQLSAGFHVDRESLISRSKARVIVRPSLTINGTPVTLSVLEEVRLAITSTDHDGVSSTREVPGFKLHEAAESEYEFQVPSRLHSLSFQLLARVQNISQNRKVDLAAGKSISLNAIQRTDKTEDVFLAKMRGSWMVELLGRTGEPLAERALQVSLWHRDFNDPTSVSLKTSDQGRVQLGSLRDIVRILVRSPQGVAHNWTLPTDGHSYHQVVNVQAGQPIQVPFMGEANEADREDISLLEVRAGTFVSDRFASIKLKDGLLQTQKLPPGEYDLWLKEPNQHVRLRVLPGKRIGNYLLGASQMLEVRDDDPLQIASLDWDDDKVTIQLENASKFSRVHFISTRYLPSYSPYASLGVIQDPEPFQMSVPATESYYAAGRTIGDELRYILDRKAAKRYPGNTLKRPSLLLNPWAVRSTSTGNQVAAKGEDFSAAGTDAATKGSRSSSSTRHGGPTGDFSNLDFLTDRSTVLLNLRPDETGRVTVPFDKFTGQHIHVVAIDPHQTAFRSASIGEQETVFRDLRLVRGLDLQKHFTQQKQVSVLPAGEKFTLDDILSSRVERYDSLASVFRLYATLSSNAQLVEFRFILNWPNLKHEEKLEKYSKYACHELNFFLSRKDPEFFDTVVQPYLANKQDTTFLDDWLLKRDLAKFRRQWEFARLNSVERVLLARSLKGELPFTRQFLGEQLAMLPPDIDRLTVYFDTALGSSALDVDGERDFGVEGLSRELTDELLSESLISKTSTATTGDAKEGGEVMTSGRALARGGRKSGNGLLALEETEAESDEMFERLGKLAQRKSSKNRAATKRTAKEDGRKREANWDIRGQVLQRDRLARNKARQLYQKLESTQEWAENNYYHLPIGQQNADLIAVSRFWNDFAQHDGRGPFFSEHLAEAHRNFTEMMLALSVLDLPFKAKEHQSEFDRLTLNITAGSPMVLFHQEIREAKMAENPTPILVSQNFFRNNDRYRTVNNERQDKFVTGEFLTHAVYGCQVVVTNPTSSQQKLNVLTQVPRGAIPVLNARYTKSIPVDLKPYHTQTIEYHFYFPETGNYSHYPVHVARSEELIAHAKPVSLKVVDEPTTIDKESWNFVSQQGSEDDVLSFLRTQNLFRVNLDRIAWRMKDEGFFRKVVALLDQRHVYSHTLWSYAVQHDRSENVGQFLRHADNFVAQCGAFIDSPLLTVDPVERRTYEHLDYSPLVNARAHQLGRRRQILNDRLHQQYHRLLHILSYRKQLDSEDRMAVTYYLLLQDRVEDAMTFFGQVKPQDLTTRLQHDYFTAYFDLYSDQPDRARVLAAKYNSHPVPRWRNAFAAVAAQLDEIGMPVLASAQDTQGQVASVDPKVALAALDPQTKGEAKKPAEGTTVIDDESRSENQTQLASTEPSFDFQVEARRVKLSFQNLESVTVNYYEMDIELLFSRNPFVQQVSGAFSYIRPNRTRLVKLPADKSSLDFNLPKDYHSSNVLVEIVAGGQTKSQAYYSHSLNVQVVENYGQVKVTHQETKKALPRTYVKVYAALANGQVRFYKDGYTDLRGRFDFTSLNTNELENVRKFSLLILSDDHGAIVREAAPPKR